MIHIVRNFIADQDLDAMTEYIESIKFNTKEDHVPLHSDLFSYSSTEFDIHTRGEMPDHILAIFSRYSKGLFDLVTSIEPEEYHPPMFSKHYLARYSKGSHSSIHWDNSKPEKTYKSYIFWTGGHTGGTLLFPNLAQEVAVYPGDLVYFIENEENSHGLTRIDDGSLVLSEAWMGIKGQLFMPSKVAYEDLDWEDWEIKGF